MAAKLAFPFSRKKCGRLSDENYKKMNRCLWREMVIDHTKIDSILHFQKKLNKPEDRKEYSRKTNARLLKLEKAAFLAGHQKAFLLFMDECRI